MDIFKDIIEGILATPEFQQGIANIILAIVAVATAGLSRAAFGFVKSKTSEQQFVLLQSLAVAAVRAAEQGELSGFVKDKKQSAFNVVNAYLQQMGLTDITAAQIDAAIESAVLTQFNAYKTQPAPAFPFFGGPLPTPVPEGGEDAEQGDPQPEEANG